MLAALNRSCHLSQMQADSLVLQATQSFFPGCSPAQMPVFHVTLINDGLLSKGSFLVSYLKVQVLFTPVNSPLFGGVIFWLCFSIGLV